MGLNKTKKLLHSKGMVTRLTRQPKEWENIFASYTSGKRLISRISRELKKTNPTKNQQPLNKWASELNRQFSKGASYILILKLSSLCSQLAISFF
jgi:hypothetical protein